MDFCWRDMRKVLFQRDRIVGHKESRSKGEVQSPAPRAEHPLSPVHAEGGTVGKQLYRKGPGSSGGHRADHEPAMCPCSTED